MRGKKNGPQKEDEKVVFIKVPKDAAPGEILGVTIENTFTTCTRCGKTFSMIDAVFPSRESPNFFAREYICVRCYMRKAWMNQIQVLEKIITPMLLTDGNEEDEEDE